MSYFGKTRVAYADVNEQKERETGVIDSLPSHRYIVGVCVFPTYITPTIYEEYSYKDRLLNK